MKSLRMRIAIVAVVALSAAIVIPPAVLFVTRYERPRESLVALRRKGIRIDMCGDAYTEGAIESRLKSVLPEAYCERVCSIDATLIKEFGDHDLGLAANFPDLRRINLAYTPISDRGLSVIRGLQHVQWIDLAGTNVTDRGLDYIAKWDNLYHLDLSKSRVVSLSPSLATCRSLNWISCANTHLDRQGVIALSSVPGLIYLDASNTPLTDSDLQQLSNRSNLHSISLAGCRRCGNSTARDLGQSPALSDCDMSGCAITDEAGEGFARSRSLSSLMLGDTQFGDAGVTALSACDSLINLHLDGSSITDLGMASLLKNTSLRRLSIERTSVGDQGIGSIIGHPSISDLRVSLTRVTDDCIPSLLNLPRLSLRTCLPPPKLG